MRLANKLAIMALVGLLILYAWMVSTWELLLMMVLVGVFGLYFYCGLVSLLEGAKSLGGFCFIVLVAAAILSASLVSVVLYIIARVISAIIALWQNRPDSLVEAGSRTSNPFNYDFCVAAGCCVGVICYILVESGFIYRQLTNAMAAVRTWAANTKALSWFRGVPQQHPYDPVADFINSGTVPKHLSCPINLTIMRNPVSTSTGHTYECSAIAKWLDSSNIDPGTGLTLDSKVLTCNWTVKGLCDDFEAKVREFDPQAAADLFPPVDMSIPERFARPPQAQLWQEHEPAIAQENLANSFRTNEESGGTREMIADIGEYVAEVFQRSRVRIRRWREERRR